jgi:hypothetical protein
MQIERGHVLPPIRFEVYTAEAMKNIVFRDIRPCTLFKVNPHFGEKFSRFLGHLLPCWYLSLFDPEDVGGILF